MTPQWSFICLASIPLIRRGLAECSISSRSLPCTYKFIVLTYTLQTFHYISFTFMQFAESQHVHTIVLTPFHSVLTPFIRHRANASAVSVHLKSWNIIFFSSYVFYIVMVCGNGLVFVTYIWRDRIELRLAHFATRFCPFWMYMPLSGLLGSLRPWRS